METIQILIELFLGLFQILAIFWPVWLILGLILAVQILFKLYRNYRLSKAGMAQVDEMSGSDFEQYLAILFKKLGYRVKKTPRGGDYGADLILKKEGDQIAVQAKRYKRNVGVKAVQEIAAAKNYYRCSNAMVVTNSRFSQQAKKLANANKVELWDRNKLTNAILSTKKTTSE